jgi:hypothetical protein
MKKRKGYIPAESEIPLLDETQPKSTFEYIKEHCFNAYKKAYSFIWRRPYPTSNSNNNHIPLYRTQVSSYFNRSEDTTHLHNSKNQQEQMFFEKHFNELDSSNLSVQSPSNSYFNKVNLQNSDYHFFNNNQQFESVDLHPHPLFDPRVSSYSSDLLSRPPTPIISRTAPSQVNNSPTPSASTVRPPSIIIPSPSPSPNALGSPSPNALGTTLGSYSLDPNNRNNSFYKEISKNPYI